jgi:hypothetical protein
MDENVHQIFAPSPPTRDDWRFKDADEISDGRGVDAVNKNEKKSRHRWRLLDMLKKTT